ncbi:hypothetical protein [Rhodococcus opacus]|uniref:Tail terminator n=1 Tax=Rhodococcus opacus (strain B4) TaxID=632772 RepID=C1B9D8_RHOOB|nr:hypothetical protein [Rhodococcus opacus]BAH52291.1 hypothetical protein ROP_40440 [Rhodococcus opacus B4]
MVDFPDWYQGSFEDAELLVMDLLQPHLDDITPQGTACTWLPDNYGDVLPIVRVYRQGGSLDYDQMMDAAQVQLGVIGRSREESWAVLGFCREILRAYKRGGTVLREDGVTKTHIHSCNEMIGPQQIPELNPDFRLVPATFEVVTRYPRGLPDYERVLKTP